MILKITLQVQIHKPVSLHSQQIRLGKIENAAIRKSKTGIGTGCISNPS